MAFAEEQEDFNIFEGELQVLRMLFVDDEKNKFEYGINTQKVEAIIEQCPLSPLPKGNEPVVGILTYRSIPIPIIDFSLLVHGKATEKLGKYPPRIVICKMLSKMIGLIVPRALPVLRISNRDVHPPADELNQNEKIPLTGVFNDGESHLLMIDIEAVLEHLVGKKEDFKEVQKSLNLEGKKILFAEDSRVMQEKIKKIFGKLGVVYTITSNGQEAWEKLESNPGAFDLLFTDIEMPIMNGIQLARKVKASPATSSLPIIFNSSISNEALINEIKTEDLGSYIIKFNTDEIVDVIKTNLTKKSGFELFE